MNKTEKRRAFKPVLIYLALSAAAVIADNIYALFGHGVRSRAMSLMFLYPLIGGAFGFFILRFAAPGACTYKWYRTGYNLYNSGIAALTAGSFFKGILDIAGTESSYTLIFAIWGWAMTAAGAILLIACAVKRRNTVP